MKIEKDKIYKLKNGLIARIYATDGPAHCLVHGAVFYNGEWIPYTWYSDGSSASAVSGTGYSIAGLHVGIAEPEPEPEPEPIIIDIAAMPAWCSWAAMDANGEWYAFSVKPKLIPSAWWFSIEDADKENEVVHIPKQYAPNWAGDWKKSCVKFR